MPRRPLPWLVLLALPTCMAAMEPETDLHFGLQGSLATPRLDLQEATPRNGLGAGLFFEKDMDNGWSVRARFDYVNFPEATGLTSQRAAGLVPSTAIKVAADQVFVGAEARKRPFSGALKNLFLFGDLGGFRTEFETAAVGYQAGTIIRDKEKTSMKLGYALGAGWQITPPFSATVRYTSVKLDNLDLATLEFGLGYRF